MIDVIDKVSELVILAGISKKHSGSSREDTTDHFEELRLLVETAGARVVSTLLQSRQEPSPSFFIGKGKVDELKAEVERTQADTVVFDNDLTPAQATNLEKFLNVKVIDRSGLILDIFAVRARTREAKTQVELAQLKYLLPRLTRQWTHLSRQQGGIGMRGPGETQLEVDRRRIRHRISHLTDVLKKIEQRRETGRKKRAGIFKAALVGYTNAGKSTLLNTLSGADVAVENKLFKTLDSVTRAVRYDASPDILISDTVGFIRNLPHTLIASFKSTLDEVRDSDILLNVIDITNHEWEEHNEVVLDTLADIGASSVDTIPVFNKTDNLENGSQINALKMRFPNAVFVSGKYGDGIEELKLSLVKAATKGMVTMTREFGPENGPVVSEIYRYGTVSKAQASGDLLKLTFIIPDYIAERLKL